MRALCRPGGGTNEITPGATFKDDIGSDPGSMADGTIARLQSAADTAAGSV